MERLRFGAYLWVDLRKDALIVDLLENVLNKAY